VFGVLLTGWLLAPAALAQLQRPVRIGALTQSWGPTPALVGLREGLSVLGYREPDDFVIGLRFTQGDATALPAAARELISQGADVLVPDSGEAARAALDATSRIPIIFIGGADPVNEGLLQSYARPGGNLTGVTSRDIELVPKRLEVFRDSVPRLKRVLFVYDATSSRAQVEVAAYRDAARRLGLTLLDHPVRLRDEARRAFDQLRRGDVHGIVVPFHVNLNIPGLAIESSPRLAIPVMSPDRFWAERGGFGSYGADPHAAGRQAARLVDKIVKGTPPGEIPVERNERIEFTLNLKVARALGITIPPDMMVRVDRVLQ
jgi:ABC-type uncharacterized transport system substrate-binding protein